MHDGPAEADDPVRVVRDGYDRVSWAYQDDAGSVDPGIRIGAVNDLATRLQPGGRVVDLGCGNGVPVTRELAGLGFDVVGVDVSPTSVDAVVAFWSIIHVPVERQPVLLDRIVSWLVPGGWFMATVGAQAWTGVEHDWLGVPGGTMYWSHTDWPTFRGWLTDRGLAIHRDYFVPEGDRGHQFVLAQLARGSSDLERCPTTGLATARATA